MKNTATQWKAFMLLLAFCICMAMPTHTQAATNTTVGPIVVIPGQTHLIGIFYTPNYGPNGVHWSNAPWFSYTKPTYNSPSMEQFGGGPDSADEQLIRNDMRLFAQIGIDYIVIDWSNEVGCSFDPQFCPGDTAEARLEFYNIAAAAMKSNIAKIYKIVSDMKLAGEVDMGIVPFIGGQESFRIGSERFQDFLPGSNGKSGIQNQMDYFLNLQIYEYPWLSLINQDGLPLQQTYNGAWQAWADNPDAAWVKVDQAAEGISSVTGKKYSESMWLEHFGACFDDQGYNRIFGQGVTPTLHGPNQPKGGWNSFGDRKREDLWYLPTFNVWPDGTPKNFNPLFGMFGKGGPGMETAWGTPPGLYAPDATLARGGQTIRESFATAEQLRPTLVTIIQYNQNGYGDQGFDFETTNNAIETERDGSFNSDLLMELVPKYKASLAQPLVPVNSVNKFKPFGYTTIEAEGVISGWAYDPDSIGTSITVHVYIDGKYVGWAYGFVANPAVNAVLGGIEGNYWFFYQVPRSYWDGKIHRVDVYGIDTSNRGDANWPLIHLDNQLALPIDPGLVSPTPTPTPTSTVAPKPTATPVGSPVPTPKPTPTPYDEGDRNGYR